VTNFLGMHTWPMWGSDGNIYFVSDRDEKAESNIWRVPEAGGEATVWVGELTSAAQERELAGRMADAVAADYRVLISEAAAAPAEAPGRRRRTLGRLRRELRRIGARDYFRTPERETARRAVEELAAFVEEPVA